jgi:hypothetical protein
VVAAERRARHAQAARQGEGTFDVGSCVALRWWNPVLSAPPARPATIIGYPLVAWALPVETLEVAKMALASSSVPAPSRRFGEAREVAHGAHHG